MPVTESGRRFHEPGCWMNRGSSFTMPGVPGLMIDGSSSHECRMPSVSPLGPLSLTWRLICSHTSSTSSCSVHCLAVLP